MTQPMITLGWVVEPNGKPVVYPRTLLEKGHVHIRGRTGSGKTSRAMLRLILDLMEPYPDKAGRVVRDPVFIFDLGGDKSLFNQVRRKADEQGRPFKFLTLNPDPRYSYYFDPFQSIAAGERSAVRMANMLIEAFNLDHGLIYGGQYFTQQNLAALLRVVKKLVASKEALTLDDVNKYLGQASRQREMKDAEQVRLSFRFLLEYQQLQPEKAPEPRAENTIDMAAALEDECGPVVYFFTPTLNESTTARQIAGLGLYSVVNAAIQRDVRGDAQRRAWVFVDEFQELAGRSFAALLSQSRKFGISIVMANQTTSQLDSRDEKLSRVVFDNTHIKIYFTATDGTDVEDLQSLSRDEKDTLQGDYVGNLGGPGGKPVARVDYRPQLTRNKILDVSMTEGHAFVVVDDGSKHKEPQAVYLGYAAAGMSYHEARTRPLGMRPLELLGPLPATPADRLTSGVATDVSQGNTASAVGAVSHRAEILALIERKKGQERIEPVQKRQ